MAKRHKVGGKTWTHKVVKVARGNQGEWFDFPTAATGTLEDMVAYARSFHREQIGVGGARITVRARRGLRTVLDLRTDHPEDQSREVVQS